MTPPTTELFHLALLRVLDANATRFGLGEPAISILVLEFGFSPKPEETVKALEYLGDSEIAFVAEVNKGQFNPANRSWKITARGINELRQRNF